MDNCALLSKQETLLNSLLTYFKNESFIEQMLPIIQGQSNISLRVLDWFVTNYAKKNNIVYSIIDSTVSIPFNVYLDYRLQLKAYNKKLFDPFCRKSRIKIDYKNKIVDTTVGQLNFFKWSIKNKILKYVEEHLTDIIKDMNASYKKNKSKNPDEKYEKNITVESNKKERHELSISATKTINKHDNIKIVVSFD